LKDQLYAKSIGEKLVLIRGRAGTGKTIKLVHIAYDLCAHRGERVLILTYNRMLVSDLQRMVALAGVSSDVDSATVEIDTVHRYIRRLLDHFKIDYDKKLFIENYNELKHTLLEYLTAGLITENDISRLKLEKRDETNWDTILIDEGQDWPDDERQILFRLFEPKNFIVACGTGQLVRSIVPANWTKGVDYHKPVISERRSLRQKRNLCEFIQLYADAFGVGWDLEPSDDLTGGQIVIVKGGYLYANGQEVAKDEVEAARWYEKAAVQGNAQAQKAFGDACADGRGTAKDIDAAANWYGKAYAFEQVHSFGERLTVM
jgi:hypothetical protein